MSASDNPRWRFEAALLVSMLMLALGGAASAQTTYRDDFERADGPVGGWTTYSGTWSISAGSMSTRAAGGDSWIWAADPPLLISGDFVAEADVAYPSTPPGEVGRHGGLMFFASVATHRGDTRMNGYTIDWIDRPVDHGMRLLLWNNGVQSNLAVGTPDLPEPPSRWRIEVEGDAISIYGDDVLLLEAFDGSHREGYFGAWAYQNATEMALDNVEITYTPVVLKACFTADPQRGGAPLTVNFDAGCTSSIHGVTGYAWDFGDGAVGTGATTTHVYDFPDTYTATLVVTDSRGNSATATTSIQAVEIAADFSDDFARADGPVDGWTPFAGQWDIVDERLTAQVSGQEYWLWAGDPAVGLPETFELNLDFEFVQQPQDAVGRHGGIMFCASDPTSRWMSSGYTIDWIDRVADHGFRFLRSDRGAHTGLDTGGAAIVDPPTHWRIVVTPGQISFYGDDVLLMETGDTTYRGGYFAVWAYSNGNSLAIDNIEVSVPPAAACFSISPSAIAPLGDDLTFDANCSSSPGQTISSYAWDFGDGGNAQGAVVEHTYAAAGKYTVKMTITTSGGANAQSEREVEIFEAVSSFEDDFARADGPPDGWTITNGNWQIIDERMQIDTPGAPESWIWAGDPPARFVGVTSVEFKLEFLVQPDDGIGRHGGVFLFAALPQPRFTGNSGYSFDWIDRNTDLGYRISRWANGIETQLVAGTRDVEPGAVWRIEIDELSMRLFADGEQKAEVQDATYRSGLIGFWSYFNQQSFAIDDVKISGDDEPPPPDVTFLRGDANSDGSLNIADASFTLNFLFLGGQDPKCLAACDANGDGGVNIADASFGLNFLFIGGREPPAPFPDCGATTNPNDLTLGCTTPKECP